MSIQLILQNDLNFSSVPDFAMINNWVDVGLGSHAKDMEVTIRIVDEAEMAELNKTYRHKDGPTNVLAFPFSDDSNDFNEPDHDESSNYLGDIAICEPIIVKEAHKQKKTIQAHWAHIVIHGTLHLLGYDHAKENEAKVMQSLEIAILKRLGYDNPYREEELEIS